MLNATNHLARPATSGDIQWLIVEKRGQTCNQCDKSFVEARTLAKHLLTHSGKKPHKCSQCKKSFGYTANLKKGYQSESTAERSHSNGICNHGDISAAFYDQKPQSSFASHFRNLLAVYAQTFPWSLSNGLLQSASATLGPDMRSPINSSVRHFATSCCPRIILTLYFIFLHILSYIILSFIKA